VDNIRVSVVIVNYNTREHLVNCLDHLAVQNEAVEVIVIDNASVDGSAAIARRPGVRLFASRENQGYAAANNLGARAAQGEFLLLLNPDAYLPPEAARYLADRLAARPELGGIAPQLYEEEGRVQRTCRRLPRLRDLYFQLTGLSRIFSGSGLFNRWKMGDFDHRSERIVEQVYASCWLLRRREFLDNGGFDTSFPIFFNDVDLARRYLAQDKPTLYDPALQVFHAGGASVRKQPTKSILQSHRSFYRYFRKYGSPFSPLRWIAGLGLALLSPLRILLPHLR